MRKGHEPLIARRCTISLVMTLSRKQVLLVCVGWFAIAAISVACWQKGKLPPLGEGPRIEYPSAERGHTGKHVMDDAVPHPVGQGVPQWGFGTDLSLLV